jgi:hypothetical protein
MAQPEARRERQLAPANKTNKREEGKSLKILFTGYTP